MAPADSFSGGAKPDGSRTDLNATGGGNATAGGVLFQQSLAAMASTWMLADAPIDPRFGLGQAKPIWLRLETNAPVDDLLVATSDGGFVAFQAKTSLSLSRKPDSAFAKTVGQFARQWLAARAGSGEAGWDRPLDTARDRLVLAVGPTTPASVRVDLAEAIRAYLQPGAAIMSQQQSKAFGDLEFCLRSIWPTLTTDALTNDVMRQLISLLRVFVFDAEGADRTALVALLMTTLPNPSEAPAAWNLLVNLGAELMSERGGVTSEELRITLAARGVRTQTRKDESTTALERALRRLAPILVIPGVLSVTASLEGVYRFTDALAGVLRQWAAFEQLFWTQLLAPLLAVFDINLQSQLFRGLTIPVVWGLIAVRLYLLRSSPPKTAWDSLPTRLPPWAKAVAIATLVYLPASFYISLNLQGMFDGYLSPEPMMTINMTLPLILATLAVLGAGYWLARTRIGSLPLSWPSALLGGYVAVLTAFFVQYQLFLVRAATTWQLLGIDNPFEAPALAELDPVVLFGLYILFAVPIYVVGRKTGRPVAIVALGVLAILGLDIVLKAVATASGGLADQ
jgi:hypothetical protein